MLVSSTSRGPARNMKNRGRQRQEKSVVWKPPRTKNEPHRVTQVSHEENPRQSHYYHISTKTLSSTSTHKMSPQHQTGHHVRTPHRADPRDLPTSEPASAQNRNRGKRGLISSSMKWSSLGGQKRGQLVICWGGEPKDVAERRGRQTGQKKNEGTGSQVGDQPRGASMAAPFGNPSRKKVCPGTFSQSMSVVETEKLLTSFSVSV